PWPLYFSYRASRPEYCGVYPHWLATFTMSTTLPLYAESGAGAPSIDGSVNSWILEAAKADDVSKARRPSGVFIPGLYPGGKSGNSALPGSGRKRLATNPPA